MRLTVPQGLVLTDLAEVEKASPYQLGMPVTVFRNLATRGLARVVAGSGQHSVWTITPAGREALSKGEKHDG